MAYLINTKGNRVGSGTYKSILPFSEGLAPFQDEQTGLWGLLNLMGRVAIAAVYQACRGFREGLAAVKLNDLWGFIDAGNQVVVPFVYHDARLFHEGFASVKKTTAGDEGMWGIIDKQGRPITECKYKFVVWFSEGRAGVCENNRFTCVDTTGKELFEPAYKFILPFTNGYATAVLPGNKQALLDKEGNRVLEGFDNFHCYRDGLMAASKDGSWGFVDIAGRTVIPFMYQEIVGGFENGMCCVKLEDRFGFINKAGQTVVPFVLREVVLAKGSSENSFKNGLAVVSLDTRKGLTSLDNKVTQGNLPPHLRRPYHPKSIFQSFGIIRTCDGEVILPFNFSEIRPYKDGLAKVSLGTKTGYVDEAGKWAVPLGNFGIASSFCEGRAIVDMEFSDSETTIKA